TKGWRGSSDGNRRTASTAWPMSPSRKTRSTTSATPTASSGSTHCACASPRDGIAVSTRAYSCGVLHAHNQPLAERSQRLVDLLNFGMVAEIEEAVYLRRVPAETPA